MKKIDVYIVRECVSPFIFGLFIFLIIFLVDLLVSLVDLTVTKGVSVYEIGKIFLYSLPALVVLVLPMACLLAILMAFSRMSADSEVTALKAGGISFFRMVKWPLILAFSFSIIGFLINDYVVPWTNKHVAEMKKSFMLKNPLPEIVEKDFFEGGSSKFIVDHVDRKKGILHDVKMFEFLKSNPYPVYLEAERSELKGGYWNFYDGMVTEYDEKGYKDYTLKFEEMRRPFNELSAVDTSGSKSPREMTFRELKEKITTYRANGIKKLESMEFELYQKVSLPFACFVFTLLAAPLAMTSARGGASIGMGMSIVIIFFYYVVMSAGRALATGGMMSPALAAWMQNIVIAVVGAFLLLRKK